VEGRGGFLTPGFLPRTLSSDFPPPVVFPFLFLFFFFFFFFFFSFFFSFFSVVHVYTYARTVLRLV